MRRRRVLRLLLGLAAGTAVLPARADTVSRLADALDGARSYKVRVQAATLLARLRDPRAAEALSRASASDPHTTVRVLTLKLLARAALAGRIPFGIARQACQRAIGDPAAPVRRQAAASLAELDRGAPDTGVAGSASAGRQTRTGALTVAVGSIGDRTGRASRALRERVRAEMRTLLAREPRVQISDSAAGVSFLIDGTISKLSLSTSGPGVEAVCAVELVVSRPPRGIVTVASGEAMVQKPRAYYQPSLRDQMEVEAMEHAVKSAHENLARFLEGQ